MATNTTHYSIKKPAGTENIDINDLNANSDKIDAAIWNTLTLHKLLTASDDLDMLYSEGTGFYVIGNDLPLNCPAGYAWSFVFQVVRNTFYHQYIVKAVSGSMLVREHSGNPPAWGAWQYIGGYTSPVQINYGSSSRVRYWKSGQTCFVTVLYNVSDGTVNAWSTKEIATLPAGFRPAEAFTQIAAVDRSADAGTCISIDSAGKVKISTRYNSFDASGDVLQYACSFPIRY